MYSFFKIVALVVIVTFASASVLRKAGNGKIIGGTPATEGEFPHQIIVWANTSSGNFTLDPQCGAALVSVDGVQLVLTSVTCSKMWRLPNLSLVAGVTDRLQTQHSQRRGATKVIAHEGYHFSSNVHDIAIIVPAEPFEINEFVAPIPLPTQGQPTTGDVIATGFGITSNENFNGAQVLQKVQMPVVPDDICQQQYALERISPYMMCAGRLGEGGQDTCAGDAGGPFKAVDGGYLAGITSFGYNECGHPDYPSVNTEVAFYIDWIKFQLDNNIKV